MLPARPSVGLHDEELPSGVVRRGPPPANYRNELTSWFAGPPEPSTSRALGTMDATADAALLRGSEAPAQGRVPFLIF